MASDTSQVVQTYFRQWQRQLSCFWQGEVEVFRTTANVEQLCQLTAQEHQLTMQTWAHTLHDQNYYTHSCLLNFSWIFWENLWEDFGAWLQGFSPIWAQGHEWGPAQMLGAKLTDGAPDSSSYRRLQGICHVETGKNLLPNVCHKAGSTLFAKICCCMLKACLLHAKCDSSVTFIMQIARLTLLYTVNISLLCCKLIF